MKIAIISDIHCHNHKGSEPKGGYYYPSMPEKPVNQNPFAALTKFIRENEIKARYLLSPGDYSHKMDSQGLKSSWDQLKLLSHEIEAEFLVGTIGNHDVDSRGKDKDPFRTIKNFDRDFPVYKPGSKESFKSILLSEGYFAIDSENIQFLVVNSSYDHWDTEESRHGKVELESLNEVQKLINDSSKNYQIVLVHHHPLIHETGIGDTEDVIHGSEEFLKCVSPVDFIIHGHKHDYRFVQHKIYPKNLNILGAGSFSCYVTGRRPLTLNSFHIIEFEENDETDCVNHGVIETYTYNPNEGWKHEAEFKEGFGYTKSLSEVVDIIKDYITKLSQPYTSWDDITVAKKQLKFISSKVRNEALLILKNDGSLVRISFDSYTKFPKEIILS